MLEPAGFALGKCLAANARNRIFAAVRKSDRRDVVLKTPTAVAGGVRLRREFEILRDLRLPGVVEALEFLEDEQMLVLGRATGISLASWLGEAQPPTTAAFLEMAVQASAALAQVHQARILHRDINPNNIVVDPVSQQVCLIDFGIALRMDALASAGNAMPGHALEGTLLYMAPEQTGRMARGVDARSDLYSLGAALYFALTGHPPFDEEDPLRLIHAHLARVPASPRERRPDLPQTLARIVLKLLHKQPEERYQTAAALHRDLTECRRQLAGTGRIAEGLELGRGDAPVRLVFPRKLYGREGELELLVAACTRAATRRSELVLIHGPAGIGKSALAPELRSALGAGARVAIARFEAQRQSVPLAGIIAALESLARQILSESDEQLGAWREALCSSLDKIAGAVIDRMPEMAALIGDVPPVPKVAGLETQARLALALQRILLACSRPEQPLVLWLDDLGCADAASLALLESVLLESSWAGLLVVGTVRDEALAAGAPLASAIGHLERSVPIQNLRLGPIQETAALAMIADVLDRTPESTRGLRDCAMRKTHGNPLLLQQFILHLHSLGLLGFEPAAGWCWNEQEIASTSIPDGAVGLMLAKLERLAPAELALLQTASCIGEQLDTDGLAELSELGREALLPRLETLVEQGLLAPCTGGYRFVHDRIREVASAGLGGAARARLHRRMAWQLLDRTPEAEAGSRIFEIADHLDLGADDLEPEQRPRALDVMLRAGRRALASGSPQIAIRYLDAARTLFREEDWERDPTTALMLFQESADAAFQNGQHSLSLELLAQLEGRPMDEFQLAVVTAKRITALTITDPQAAIALGLRALRGYGVRWPRNPSWVRVRWELAYTRWCLRGSLQTQAFAGVVPPDRHSLSSVLVASALVTVLTRDPSHLLVLLTGQILRSFHRHGAYRSPASYLAAYAGLRLWLLDDWRGLPRLIEGAQYWSEHTQDPKGPRGRVTLYMYAYAWLHARRGVPPLLSRATQAALEVGDIETASLGAQFDVLLLGMLDTPLGDLQQRLVALRPRERWPLMRPFLEVQGRANQLLRSESAQAIDWTAELALLERCYLELGYSRSRMVWLPMLCIFGQYEAAFSLSCLNGLEFSRLGACRMDHTLFRGLAAAVLAQGASGAERRRLRREFRSCLRTMRSYVRHAPDAVHMTRWLEAESSRLEGASRTAVSLYQTSAQHAVTSGYRHHAALAQERRADLLHELGRSTEERAALLQAIALYKTWGAKAKIAQLQGRVKNVG